MTVIFLTSGQQYVPKAQRFNNEKSKTSTWITEPNIQSRIHKKKKKITFKNLTQTFIPTTQYFLQSRSGLSLDDVEFTSKLLFFLLT